MFRLNGVGLGFAGVSTPDLEGNCTATQWFTIFFVPVFPIARFKVKPLRKVPFQFEYQVLSKQKLVFREVLKTYFYGWILFPLMIFGPFLLLGGLGTPEAEKAFGIPEWTQLPFILLSIAWLGVAVWRLRTWDCERWFKKAR